MTRADGPIATYLARLVEELRPITDGKPATYIPELGKADPSLFGVALATVDGTLYTAGDADHPFTIQSISKPFVYAHALDRLGRARVLAHVGVEPTGESFNAITLDEANNRPFNPMVNSGAIATSELIAGDTSEEQRSTMLALFERFAGRSLPLDDAVYRSEKATGHRNRAIAWMMFNQRMITHEPEEVLDLYFRQCSLLADCRDLALMAATLANEGVNPRTGHRAVARPYVTDVLSVMHMCGMYNYAGQWSYEIGLPAKSGVSGGIMLVVPGQAGIAIYSPALDDRGNSVRGIAACRRIAQDFALHIFGTHPSGRNVIRLAYRGDAIRSKCARSPAEARLLDRLSKHIRVLELQDALYFGSTERLVRHVRAQADGTGFLILDFRRVGSIDLAARRLLVGLVGELAAHGQRLLFAHLEEQDEHHALRDEATAAAGGTEPCFFADRDAALEHAEDALLASAGVAAAAAEVPFPGLDLVRGLAPGALERLQRLATKVRFTAGEHLARRGQPADRLFGIASGRASVRLGEADHGFRLGSVGPGMTCGELALLDPAPRSADICAETAIEAYAIDIAELRALATTDPELMLGLTANVARELAERLRLANEEIAALEG